MGCLFMEKKSDTFTLEYNDAVEKVAKEIVESLKVKDATSLLPYNQAVELKKLEIFEELKRCQDSLNEHLDLGLNLLNENLLKLSPSEFTQFQKEI